MSDQATPAAPAGWYPDPDGTGQRYWDGAAWSDYRAPAAPPVATERKGNAAGVTGLVLGLVGTLLGLIPGVIIFVWPLLAAAFVVSIVGLAMNGRPKVAAAFGLVLSLVGVGTGVISIFVAAALSTNSSQGEAPPTLSDGGDTQIDPADAWIATYSGDGDGSTAPQLLPAGDYKVDWATTGDCYYGADLESSTTSEQAFTASTIGSGTNYVYDIPAGDYRIEVITGASPGCPWTATLTQQ